MKHVRNGRWDEVAAHAPRLTALSEYLSAQFAPRGFTDTAYDRMGARAGGFLAC